MSGDAAPMTTEPVPDRMSRDPEPPRAPSDAPSRFFPEETLAEAYGLPEDRPHEPVEEEGYGLSCTACDWIADYGIEPGYGWDAHVRAALAASRPAPDTGPIDGRLRERLDEALTEWWDDDHGRGTHGCRPRPSEGEFLVIAARLGLTLALSVQEATPTPIDQLDTEARHGG